MKKSYLRRQYAILKKTAAIVLCFVVVASSVIYKGPRALADDSDSTGIGTIQSAEIKELTPGLNYQVTESSNTDGLQKSHTLTYNPKTASVKPEVTSGQYIWGAETVAQMAAEQSGTVVAAVNGSFFDINNGTPRGEVIENGELTSCVEGYDRTGTTTYPSTGTKKNGYALVGFRKDGTFACGVGNYSIKYTVKGADGTIKTNNWDIDYFNKYYSPMTSWKYLFSSKYGTSTHTDAPGTEIVMDVQSGTMQLGGIVTAKVVEKKLNSTDTPIGANQLVLYAANQSNKFSDLSDSHINVGDTVTISVSDLNESTNHFADSNNPVVNAVTGLAVPIVENGQVTQDASQYADEQTLNPRTAIGVKADGSVVLFQVDGRQDGWSEGMNGVGIGEYMVQQGCERACFLDGGGSSTTLVRQPGDDSLSLANRPSDGSERADSDCILLVSTATVTHQFASAYVTPSQETVPPQSTVQFSAKGRDSSGASADLPSSGLQWSLYDNSYGTIDATTGAFVSNGKLGKVNIILKYNGNEVGSASLEIENPDSFTSSANNVTMQPGDTKSLGLTATYQGHTVKFTKSDVTWSIPDNLGTVDNDNNFVAGTTCGSGNITAKFNNTNLSVTIHIQVGQDPVVVENCESLTDDTTAQSLWTSFPGKRGEQVSVGASTYPDSPVRFGNHSVRVDFDFTQAQKNTTLTAHAGPKTVTESAQGTPTSFGVWVYGTPETQGMSLWFGFVDGNGNDFGMYMPPETGEPYIANLGQIYWEGWKYISIPIDTSAHPGPIKLQDNGYAIDLISLKSGTTGGGPMTKGSIYFDNFRFVYGTANDDLYAPIIDSVNVDGKAYNSSSVNISANIHDDTSDKYMSGINWDRVRVLVDGKDYTSDKQHFSYDKDGIVYLSGYQWSDGTHKVTVDIQDNFGNETTKDVYFTVNTGNGSKLSLEPQANSVQLGGTGGLVLKADDMSTVTGATATVTIGKGYPVTSVDFAQSAAQSTYQYDASTGNLTLNIQNRGAAQSAGTLATIHVSAPNTVAQGSSIAYSASGAFTLTSQTSTSFISSFSASGSLSVAAGLNITVGQMVVGSPGTMTVTTADGKAAAGADVTFLSADGTKTDLGTTGADGTLQSTVPTQTAQKFTLWASLGDAYSFDTSGQSYNPQLSATPQNLLAGSTQDASTEKTFTWMTNPLQGENKAVMQIALQSDYEKNGESAFKHYTGTRQLITYSSDSSAVELSSVTATGLSAGTTYSYRVGDGTNWSDVRSFTTLKADDDRLTFNVFGDTQVTNTSGLSDFSTFLSQIESAATKPAFSIHVGDFTDDQTNFSEMNMTANMFSQHAAFDSLDAIHVLGNHEYMGDDGTKSAAILGLADSNGPDCDKTGTYSVDYGNMHIAVLGWTDNASDMAKKMDWLRQDMKSTNKTWKIIATHQPTYNKNPDDSSTLFYDTLPQVCDELGIDIVFSGHDHSYGRTYPIYNKTAVTTDPTNCNSGTVYISAGHTGDKTYDINPVYPDAFAKVQAEANKDDKVYLTCTVNSNKMNIKVTDSENGATSDDVTLTAHKADKTALQSGITTAKALLAGAQTGDGKNEYPQSAVNGLSSAIIAAQTVNTDDDATPEEVCAAISSLGAAVNTFKSNVVTVDETALDTLVDTAGQISDSNSYTVASWDTFQSALQAAKGVQQELNPTQQEIDSAYNVLDAAQKGLASSGDPTSLNVEIALTGAYQQSDYTADSWSGLQKALESAQSAISARSGQTTLDAALVALKKAVNTLAETGTKRDTGTGVTLTVPEGTLPVGSSMHVSQIQSGKDYHTAAYAVRDVSSKFVLYDISVLLQNGTVWEPSSNISIQISLPIPAGYDTSRLAVYYIDDNGNKEMQKGHVENGYYVFMAQHLSRYLLAEVNNTSSEETSSDNNSTGSTSSSSTSTSSASTSSAASASNPDTGSSSVPTAVGVLALVLGTGVFLLKTGKKKK
ncbi:phosphodiester glycosidase family protein [Ethanoligenens harbinense]|uniref:Metallophosphoesterase n=1 Tax=Ethanoligenens harbinense (strain DSM 18485 / JCM 12961 / CGMCC 1.5033 / YUAN-3) TaxID=663278 RepID=E6U9D8_ETHHY|nr:phosphodiester glycosidase family protein [Ethanoligenens harbinense]ADU26129.1 metallophosphoesterase [Ethanoligenens harbinense YUAN-3]